MSLIGGIVGGMIGFTLLGPIGALVGSVMGSRMTRQAKSRRNPNNLDHQVAFFTALFACLAKIAKADGRVSEEEVSKIESFISNKFNFSEDERNFAINIFQKAKSDSVSFEAYAKQLYQLLGSSPNSLLVFYELLFELAMADGEMHENEERLLRKIPNIFGFDKNVYKDLYNKYVGNISNAYEILGVSKGMTLEEIKKWRSICPEITLRSTFIVGYPGETEDEFNTLIDWLDEAQLDRVGCFKYENVEGARSNALAHQISEEVKQHRWEVFMEKAVEISAKKLAKKIGKEIDVIVDEIDEEGAICRTKADAPEIDGNLFIEDNFEKIHVGDIVKVNVTASGDYDLWGIISDDQKT